MSQSLIPALQLIDAYSKGYFPMAEPDGEIYWHCPQMRAVFPLDSLAVPRKLQNSLRKSNFYFSINKCFEEVILQCSNRRDTWISETIINSYIELYRLGFAHSVETWENGILVGGLYGVTLGGAFFGESMFNSVTNASKAAFYHLVERLKTNGFTLLDSQYINHFTLQLGAIEIPKPQYLKLLKKAIQLPVEFN